MLSSQRTDNEGTFSPCVENHESAMTLNSSPRLFDDDDYHHTYYAAVMEDELAILDWLASIADPLIREQLPAGNSKRTLLDAGSGPTVHHLFALVPHFAESVHERVYCPCPFATHAVHVHAS